MGVGVRMSAGDPGSRPVSPNPDPANFTVVRCRSVGPNCVAEVIYPGCTTYEGRKVLVYKGVTSDDLMAARRLDPHFHEREGEFAPYARFEPTEAGWRSAVLTAISI